MGCFSNSSEGMAYEAQYCDRCMHNPDDPDAPGCSVWFAHLMYNYEQFENEKVKRVLDALIPQTEDHLGNLQCTMFLERPELPDPNQTGLPL